MPSPPQPRSPGKRRTQREKLPRGKTPPAKTSRSKVPGSRSGEAPGLTQLALRACLVASDAAFNASDFLSSRSQIAFIAVRDCEKELDRIEQQMDQQLPAAITHVDELEARELLACLRFSNELERIGDLLWWVTQRAQTLPTRLPKADSQPLLEMTDVLEKMLQSIREGFTQRDLDPASFVLRADREVDQLYRDLFRRHVAESNPAKTQQTADVLLMGQALERAGDHATNLAEELFRLIEGRSLRHIPKKRVKD
jgi:phosphate transport system protein